MIDEIQRKNREYDELKTQYHSLINEINSSMHQEVKKVNYDKEAL